MSDLTALYQSVILDHSRRPRHHGKLPAATRVVSAENPTCGDLCTVYVRIEGGIIADMSCDGAGCAISQASASVMATTLIGLSTEEARTAYQQFQDIVTTGRTPETFSELSAFAGVHAYPARIKCATLAWRAALDAIAPPNPSVSHD